MRPELPYLAAGAVTIIGGTLHEGHLPTHTQRAVLGTLALVLIASATSGSKVAPVVRAIGVLLLLGAVMGATRVYLAAKATKKAK